LFTTTCIEKQCTSALNQLVVHFITAICIYNDCYINVMVKRTWLLQSNYWLLSCVALFAQIARADKIAQCDVFSLLLQSDKRIFSLVSS